MASRSLPSGDMCFSVPATVRENPTVFGIEKQNQDVYNKEELAKLIGKTVITRKFRDFAGENTGYGHIPSSRPAASARFTVSSSRSSAVSASCITTARETRRKMP